MAGGSVTPARTLMPRGARSVAGPVQLGGRILGARFDDGFGYLGRSDADVGEGEMGVGVECGSVWCGCDADGDGSSGAVGHRARHVDDLVVVDVDGDSSRRRLQVDLMPSAGVEALIKFVVFDGACVPAFGELQRYVGSAGGDLVVRRRCDVDADR
jgi:hypothetical protein